MGCCASTHNKAASAPHIHHHSSWPTKSETSSRAQPPHPSLEEETVKEVLSETPTPKPKLPNVQDEAWKATSKPAIHKIQEEEEEDNNVDKKPLIVPTEEISEVSEICSTLSESVSTATVTDKREDDDGEVRQRVDRSPAKFRNRPFSGDFLARRDRVVGKSLARRSEPSPGRVKSVPGRERRGLVPDGQWRGSGDSSGRRSSSPAKRADGGAIKSGFGRSPSARRSGKSPGRVRSYQPEKNRKVEDGDRDGKWPPITNESLENPLVSLECFIFL